MKDCGVMRGRRLLDGCIVTMLLVLGLFVLGACEHASNNTKSDIANGEVGVIEDAPYLVALSNEDGNFCGGAIIDSLHVLTAAHCVDDFDRHFQVIAGRTHLSDGGGQVRDVNHFVMPYEYEDALSGNDIAILELSNPLVFNDETVAPIALAVGDFLENHAPVEGDMLSIMGYGALVPDGAATDTVRFAQVPYFTGDTGYETVPEDQFTAGGGLADTCQGDSGGPIVIKGADGVPYLLGVVSWGEDCGSMRPGFYTSIAAHTHWFMEDGTVLPLDDIVGTHVSLQRYDLSAGETQTWTLLAFPGTHINADFDNECAGELSLGFDLGDQELTIECASGSCSESVPENTSLIDIVVTASEDTVCDVTAVYEHLTSE